MSDKSDTPRTDEFAEHDFALESIVLHPMVLERIEAWADFARRLERERAELADALRFYANRLNWNPVADYADGYWYIAGTPWMKAVAALKDSGCEVDLLAASTITDPLDTEEAR